MENKQPQSAKLICPNLRCRKILVIDEQLRGRLVKCQYCSTLFRVPGKKGIDNAKT